MKPFADPIPFERALGELLSTLGSPLRTAFLVDDKFFGVAFTSPLERIETLPDNQTVTLCFVDGETIDLDPRETAAFRLPDHPGGLEFRIWVSLVLEITLALEIA